MKQHIKNVFQLVGILGAAWIVAFTLLLISQGISNFVGLLTQ